MKSRIRRSERLAPLAPTLENSFLMKSINCRRASVLRCKIRLLVLEDMFCPDNLKVNNTDCVLHTPCSLSKIIVASSLPQAKGKSTNPPIFLKASTRNT